MRNVALYVALSGRKCDMSDDGLRGRISEAIKVSGGIDEVAKSAWISVRTLYSYMSGETKPSATRIRQLAEATGYSVEWLLTGGGPKRHEQGEASVARDLPGRYEGSPVENCVYFPLGDNQSVVSPQIPPPTADSSVDVLAISGRWILSELHSKPADLMVAHVPGDSMSPFLRPGDVVLLDSSDVSVSREGVYFIRMDGTVVVKQLQRLPGGVVRVSSRNPEYEPFTVKMDEVRSHAEFSIMGRVACALVRF